MSVIAMRGVDARMPFVSQDGVGRPPRVHRRFVRCYVAMDSTVVFVRRAVNSK